VQYERGQFIIAERNPNYWRNNMPYLDRVVWRVVGDRAAAAAQMEAGQLLFSPYSAPCPSPTCSASAATRASR
jgi:peptide/nickel transport system substrate-binding protein